MICRRRQRDDLCMGSRVLKELDLVESFSNDLSLVNDERAHRHFVLLEGFFSLEKCQLHPLFVLGHCLSRVAQGGRPASRWLCRPVPWRSRRGTWRFFPRRILPRPGSRALQGNWLPLSLLCEDRPGLL